MDTNLLNILGLSFIGSVFGLIGGIVFLLNKRLASLIGKYAISFAAGILLTVAFLDLLPEAVTLAGEKSYLIILLAFLGSFLFEEYLTHIHHHEGAECCSHHTAIPLVIVGDTIHNFIDGVAIAAAYMTDPAFGVVLTVATLLHEIPHEISDFGILIAAGWKKTKVFIVNLASALATFGGAILTYYVFKGENALIGALLAISGGIFIYLGASDFLPQVSDKKDGVHTGKKLFMFLLGFGIIFILTRFVIE